MYQLWQKGEWGQLLYFSSQKTGMAPAAELSIAVWQLAARMQQEAAVMAANSRG